ncbi:hypothetical protein BJ875DRAFT_451157 [Amylocarpus encephaloides]|uniref:Uncharacterized protein n=1 Tax=Amylocarpus encephaloides TaxID=45428 RepID=A0A9P7YR44_9HELO|nr:hypothetical protein BJ875DRAFT_451157 [Amylocarpus encephaloides]
MDSSSVYSEKGKGKESDTGLAKAMMSVVVDAKKVTTTPQVGAPKRTSQSLFQRLMKGKYEPAIASQSSSATPTSNPQNSSPKFFFKPKYIPGNGSSSSAPPKYKPDERQQGLKSKFKEMVVDEDGEAIIGEFHDVSDNEDDEYDSSDDDSSDDGTDAGDEANFDPDETAVEGTAEQQEIILTDADRQEAMLRYNYIQPEADEQETSAALEMAEVVNKLSHNM